MAPEQQAENTLKEAFPGIEPSVVKAVLRASGGRLEPAFNALLGMSDPDAAEPPPPAQPPRRQQSPLPPTLTQEEQMIADEQYARQLAEHYNGVDTYGERQASAPRQQIRGPQRKPNGPAPYEEDRERSFIDGL